MTDIDINGNVIFLFMLAYGLAWACLGAAFAFGVIERARKRNAKTKHTPTSITA